MAPAPAAATFAVVVAEAAGTTAAARTVVYPALVVHEGMVVAMRVAVVHVVHSHEHLQIYRK
jgi:hypothetical protein